MSRERYKIVHGQPAEPEFSKTISELVAQGWEPCGFGLSTAGDAWQALYLPSRMLPPRRMDGGESTFPNANGY